MIIGSHNSWSYLPVKQWYLRPIAFMARCQRMNIKTQYTCYGIRCFDLRVRFTGDKLVIAHGIFEYECNFADLTSNLKYLNIRRDCCVRVIHEVRKKEDYTPEAINNFREFCCYLTQEYEGIKFWCGRNLYNWDVDYTFDYNPSCEENYSSVKTPKLIDDWFPWLYAKLHNKKIYKKGTDKDILLIDFVDINR